MEWRIAILSAALITLGLYTTSLYRAMRRQSRRETAYFNMVIDVVDELRLHREFNKFPLTKLEADLKRWTDKPLPVAIGLLAAKGTKK